VSTLRASSASLASSVACSCARRNFLASKPLAPLRSLAILSAVNSSSWARLSSMVFSVLVKPDPSGSLRASVSADRVSRLPRAILIFYGPASSLVNLLRYASLWETCSNTVVSTEGVSDCSASSSFPPTCRIAAQRKLNGSPGMSFSEIDKRSADFD
jgi:hypothetical protein